MMLVNFPFVMGTIVGVVIISYIVTCTINYVNGG